MKTRWETDSGKIITGILDRKAGVTHSYLIETYNSDTVNKNPRKKTVKVDGQVVSETTVDASRDARQNSMIRWVQVRKFGRNPWFISRAEYKVIRDIVRGAMGGITGQDSLEVAAVRIGEYMRDKYREHIRTKRSRTGPTPEVNEKRKKTKIRIHGKYQPPLLDTGQLLDSIRFRVSKVR